MISPQALHELRQSDPTTELIDVRTPAEFAQVHAPAAKLLPLASFDPNAFREREGERIYVICHIGPRAIWACQHLAAVGVDAVNVQGGMQAWVAAGLPVVRGDSGSAAPPR